VTGPLNAEKTTVLSLQEFKEKLATAGYIKWSEETSLEFFWCFPLKATRAQLWPYLSDTSRFNREMGFATRTQTEDGGKLFVKTSVMGIAQEWVEEPWNWLEGRVMVSSRNYLRGLAEKMQAVFYIEEADGARHVYIYFGWKPASFFWKLFLSATELIMKKRFGETFEKIDRHFAIPNPRANALRANPKPLGKTAKENLTAIRDTLLLKNLNGKAVEQLVDYVERADDMDLESIRLIPLAAQWNLELKDLLTAALHGTRQGLLKISWEVICPHCRGSRFSAQTLGDLPETSQCGVCEITFETDTAEAIEVVFHVHPNIRLIQPALFCAAEPAKKSHIKVQLPVAPKSRLHLQTDLPAGSYRVRYLGIKQPGVDLSLVKNSELIVKNERDQEAICVVEELWWDNKALKPAQLLAIPDFRDLFSEEHLNANVKLFLGEQTIFFTDIVGSTKFYNEVGDAKAFAEVRSHFQEVFQFVKSHRGVVVKTIGDAVMASFTSPADALAAAIEIQKAFHVFRSSTSVRLRISIHSGPVIAVQLNTGLDYFGNTVNHASKIQSCAGVCEIAVSRFVYDVYQASVLPQFPVEKRRNHRDSAASDVFVLKVAPVLNKAA
jgi:class 3 adenylate cyclase